MVVQRTCNAKVVGSIPTSGNLRIAQSGRAPGLGLGGRMFEPCCGDQFRSNLRGSKESNDYVPVKILVFRSDIRSIGLLTDSSCEILQKCCWFESNCSFQILLDYSETVSH
jgi:hypothetical protein